MPSLLLAGGQWGPFCLAVLLFCARFGTVLTNVFVSLAPPDPLTDTKQPGSFEPEVYYNDTYGLGTSTQPTVYQRVPQQLNLAVTAWLRSFVGEGAAGMHACTHQPQRLPSSPLNTCLPNPLVNFSPASHS